MGKLLVFLLVAIGAAWGDTAETAIFRVVMLPSSEVPAVNSSTRGTADILANVVRDNSGQIVSGTVDILARVTFAAAATATGLNIHTGAAGQNGAIVFSTGLSAASPRAMQNNGDSIHIPVEVTGTDSTSLNALRGLFQDASKYYLNLLTSDSPNGAIRGQLQRAQMAVVLGQLHSGNAVPPGSVFAAGVAQIVAIGTKDANGNWTSGEVYFSARYTSFDATTITTFQIHQGAPGINTAAVISATMPPSLAADPAGAVAINPLYTEVTITNAAQLAAFASLFTNPGALYVDMHTALNPTGIARAQLRPTDAMPFSVTLDSSNETGFPNAVVTAPSTFTLYTLRNEDGAIAAATILCDVDFRFPGPTQMIGLYVRNAAAKQNGPPAIPLAGGLYTDTGFGNYFAWTLPIADLATAQDLVESPENHYASLHTMSDPVGAARAQFGPPVKGPSAISGVINAALDKNGTTIAPGGLVSIFGTNLARTPADLSGWTGKVLPTRLNGVEVTIGGVLAPLVYVSPTQINAQVPVEVASGTQALVVNTSIPAAVKVAPVAPEIFFSPIPAVLKNSNYSVISSTNPARSGEVILIYATGLGQTNAGLATGALVPPGTFAQTSIGVLVTIGGKDALVQYAIESPSFAGLYQVAVTVPSGVTGSVPLVIQQGSATSNTVNITVQ